MNTASFKMMTCCELCWIYNNINNEARRQTTVTSQESDLPYFHGTRVRPSGLMPSWWNGPAGSIVDGIPVDWMIWKTRLLRALCPMVLLCACLQTKPWIPMASTVILQWHLCSRQRFNPGVGLLQPKLHCCLIRVHIMWGAEQRVSRHCAVLSLPAT